MSDMLTIDVDLGDVSALLSPRFADQLAFATAGALNNVGFEARKKLIEELPQHFVVRSTWTERGFGVDKAKKTSLEVVVGNTRPYMEQQTLGGPKRSASGADVAVPVCARKTPQSKTTRAKWPSRLLAKPRYFIVRTKKGDTLLARRLRTSRWPIEVLYRLRPQVEIKPEFPLEKIVAGAVAVAWAEACYQAVQYALRTAKTTRKR